MTDADRVLSEVKALASEIVVIREQLARGAARFDEYDRTLQRLFSELWPELNTNIRATLDATNEIRVKVSELDRDVRQLSSAVYGNGKPGLAQRIDGQGSSLDRLRERFEESEKRCAKNEQAIRTLETHEAERRGQREGVATTLRVAKVLIPAVVGGGGVAALQALLGG